MSYAVGVDSASELKLPTYAGFPQGWHGVQATGLKSDSGGFGLHKKQTQALYKIRGVGSSTKQAYRSIVQEP
jgi:hypothetical protein